MIAENLKEILSKIENSKRLLDGSGSNVRLLAVSKTFPSPFLKEAYDAGQKLFGENYVQEALEKIEDFKSKGLSAEFHLIGPLQSNKVKKVIGKFSLIHSVDRLSLLREISKVSHSQGIIQDILIQVNTSKEETKSGVSKEKVSELVSLALELPGINLKGLMCIGAYYDSSQEEDIRASDFIELYQIRDSLEEEFKISLPELSMGMSHDFELAIKYGATIVRVGSGIFGIRGYRIET